VEPESHASAARSGRVESVKQTPSAPGAIRGDEVTRATLARLAPGARGVMLGRSLKRAPGISNRAAARILARDATGTPRNARNGTFRQTVMAVLRPFAETVLAKGQKPGEPDVYGAAEGSELFHSIISASTVTAGRKQTALDVLEGRTGKDTHWTSCIAFLTAVLGKGAAASGGTILRSRTTALRSGGRSTAVRARRASTQRRGTPAETSRMRRPRSARRASRSAAGSTTRGRRR
jgi:hypothetical protein